MKENDSYTFLATPEEDGNGLVVLVKGELVNPDGTRTEKSFLLKHATQTKPGGDIYGEVEGKGCCITVINNSIVIIVVEKVEGKK